MGHHLQNAVMDHTLKRRIALIKARRDVEGLECGDVDETLIIAVIKPLAALCNGDLRRPRSEHYCNDCCVNEHGVWTREACVNNVLSAFVATGIWGGVNHVVPAIG